MIDFTKEERTVIAEFVFSEQQDILIVSDAMNLIDVLYKHNLIDNKEAWIEKVKSKDLDIISALEKVMNDKISNEQGTQIMNEYYSIISDK